ncbi:MAG: hypothetical protein OSP8Acid_01610 [uncultured Acidilobus sp. OSP8]|nr:MAG: hypothetical protein OSP8Acid_01610 [uncultured Acidilobus sp. OSP8]
MTSSSGLRVLSLPSSSSMSPQTPAHARPSPQVVEGP